MTYISSASLEPPDPEPWFCYACDKGDDECECVSCESCGERGSWDRVQSEDEVLWMCKPCIAI